MPSSPEISEALIAILRNQQRGTRPPTSSFRQNHIMRHSYRGPDEGQTTHYVYGGNWYVTSTTYNNQQRESERRGQ